PRLPVPPVCAVLAGRPKWTPVADFPDEVTGFDLDADSLYLLTTQGHPRGRLLKTSAKSPDLAAATEVGPESALVLQNLARGQDGLSLRAMDGGISKLLRLGRDDKVGAIALPFDGTLAQVETDPQAPGAFLLLSGWLNANGVWRVDP